MKKSLGLGLVGLVALLTACGSGGGGSSSMSYQGITSQAVINNSATAAELSETAYFGSQVNDVLPLASLQAGPQGTSTGVPVIQALSQLVLELPNRMDFSAPVENVSAMSFSDPPEECLVDGTVAYSGTVDDATGAMRVTASYSNCDDGGGFIANGSMVLDMDAQFSALAVELNIFSMDFIAEQQKITVDGVIRASQDASSGTETLSMTLVLRDDVSAKMAKLDNYQVVVTDMGSYYQADVSGTVYSSEQGYVELFTVEPILLDYYTEEPYAGIYRIAGDAGTWAEYDFATEVGTFGNASGAEGNFYLTAPQ